MSDLKNNSKQSLIVDGPIFEWTDENRVLRLKQVRQKIGGTTQLPASEIDEMIARKDDLEFQLSICGEIITEKSILPFPFERAAILLHKAKRCEEELKLCNYVETYIDNWRPTNSEAWDLRESPVLQKIVRRKKMKHHMQS